MNRGTTFGIVSLKGGVGKTTVAVNLATSLAHDYNKKVLLVDANLSSPHAGLHLGIVPNQATLHHVLADKAQIHQAIYEHHQNLHVLPASLVHTNVDMLKLKQKLLPLRKQYDYIVVDSSPLLNEELLGVMHASDHLVVVTTPDNPTLSTTLRAIKLAKEKHTPILGLVINKMRGKKYELQQKEIEAACHVPVLGVLHDDQKALEALTKIQPLTLYRPYNKTAQGMKQLAATLIGVPYQKVPFWKKILHYLRDDFQNFRSHNFKIGFRYY
ncbi:AAA family ATPase [Candidatus Woesearchaeota archaeon]|nr:AAA family ATPase [Candidatus Woesearchaeota archaeon]